MQEGEQCRCIRVYGEANWPLRRTTRVYIRVWCPDIDLEIVRGGICDSFRPAPLLAGWEHAWLHDYEMLADGEGINGGRCLVISCFSHFNFGIRHDAWDMCAALPLVSIISIPLHSSRCGSSPTPSCTESQTCHATASVSTRAGAPQADNS